jgi:hypothetical protein
MSPSNEYFHEALGSFLGKCELETGSLIITNIAWQNGEENKKGYIY